jgi:hypothetical protein
MLSIVVVASLALLAQSCTPGGGAPPGSARTGDVSARTSKLLSPATGRGVTTWGQAGDERGSAVAADAAGNIYVTGSTNSFGLGTSDTDILIAKYSRTGLEWLKTWNGGLSDSGKGIAVGPDGFIYVVGGTQNASPSRWFDMIVFKLDTAGSVVWSKTWSGPSFDVAYDLAFDGAGNLLVVGESYDCGAGCLRSAVLLKVTPNGAPVWSRAFNNWSVGAVDPSTTSYTSGYSLNVDAAGDIVIGGMNWYFGSVLATTDTIFVIKADANGNAAWASEFRTAANLAESMNFHSVTTDPDRNVYMGGRVCSFPAVSCDHDPLILKLDPAQGKLTWARTLTRVGFDTAGSLAWDSRSGIDALVVSGVRDGQGLPEYFVSRYDATGMLLDYRHAKLGALPAGGAVGEVGMTLGPHGLTVVVGQALNAAARWEAESVVPGDVPIPDPLSLNQFTDHVPLATPTPTLTVEDVLTPPVDRTGVIDDGGGGPDLFLSGDGVPSLTGAVTWNGSRIPPNLLNFRVDGTAITPVDATQDDSYEIFDLAAGVPHTVTLFSQGRGGCGPDPAPLGLATLVTLPGVANVANIDLSATAGKLEALFTVSSGWLVPPEVAIVSLNGPTGCWNVFTNQSGLLEAYLGAGTYSGTVKTIQGIPLGTVNFDITAGEVKSFAADFPAPAGVPIGGACTATSECVAGAFCADGFCCDAPCGGDDDTDCQVCAATKGASANGACTMLPATHQCRASGGGLCDLGAFCGGGPACPANAPAPAATTCRTRPAGDQCAFQEAAITCGGNLTCPAPTSWQSGGCEAQDSTTLEVRLSDGAIPPGTVSVQFADVYDGTISVTRATGCPAATGFTFPPSMDPTVDPASIYWDLNAEPPLDCGLGTVEVCVTYPQAWFGAAESPMEALLQLRHGNAAAQISPTTCDAAAAGWTYLPQSRPVDTVNNIVCGNTCSLSPFALMIPVSLAQVPTVQPHAPIVAEATSVAGAVVTFTASATDLKDGTLLPACLPASGGVFPVGTTTVKCNVTNSDHLTGSAAFTVTVLDKGPMFSNVPASPIVAYATSTAGAKVTYAAPIATDAVDGRAAVKCLPLSGSTFGPGKTVVTCNAADNHGHASPPATFTVWVQYQAPTDGTFFLLPIRANGGSIFRIGRPVPVRFKLTGASAAITDLQAKLVVTKISSTVQGTSEDASDETVDDTDLLFKYRALLRWYAYRWKTSNQTQGTYRLEAVLGDGVTHQINVSLKGK